MLCAFLINIYTIIDFLHLLRLLRAGVATEPGGGSSLGSPWTGLLCHSVMARHHKITTKENWCNFVAIFMVTKLYFLLS